MYQQLWGYKVEEKLYLGAREQKSLNTTGLYLVSFIHQRAVFKIVCTSYFSVVTGQVTKH
jgi:hypothetical protein